MTIPTDPLGEITISKAVQSQGDNENGDVDGRLCKILKDSSSSITNLPGDCLNLIFKCLETKYDRDSFGLTCHDWLHIQNHNRESLWYRDHPRSISKPRIYILPEICSECFPEVVCKLLTRFPNVRDFSLKWRPKIKNLVVLQSLFIGSKIQNLCLRYCSKYSDTELSLMFSWLPRLRKISLVSSAITDKGLDALAKWCSSLEIVYILSCKSITDTGVESLAKCCSSLQDVSVSHCQSITDKGLESLANFSSSLRKVNMSACRSITDRGLEALAKCSSLQTVNVASCPSITDLAISFLLHNCRELRSLTIDFCRNITGICFLECAHTLTFVSAFRCKLEPEGINAIVSSGGLQFLNVGYGCNINNEAVIAMSKVCTLLKNLDLSCCTKVKLDGWEAIGQNCKKLESLVVIGCKNLCDLGLNALCNGCHKLSNLYIDNGNSCSRSAVELFERRKPNVLRKCNLRQEYDQIGA